MRKIISICLLLLLTGCASTMKSHLDDVQKNFANANFETPDTEIANQKNLDLLINGTALFHANKYQESDSTFEEFNKRKLHETSTSISRETAGLLLGQGVNSYKPYMMDSLFVSYYQLWAAISDARWNDARVIINQSYARQQDMSRAYQELIESNQTKISNSEIAKTLKNEQWVAYRDIMNPALMYLSGIYFLNNGDFADAKTYLGRANGMMPNNSFIARDLKLAESKQRPQNTVWVFIEDGFAPKLTEKRITLPVASGNGTTMVTVAISEPQFLESYVKFDSAELLADVDAMFITEYSEYRTNDALRAFTSAASRVVLQSSLYNSHSSGAPLLGLMSTIYSEFTNNAEVRTWATLPKTISVMRAPITKSGLIELRSNGNVIKQISIGTDGNYLVYVRTTPNKYDIKQMKLK